MSFRSLRSAKARTATVLLFVSVVGCGGASKSTTPAPPPASVPGPQNYFAPTVAGVANEEIGINSFIIDDVLGSFYQSTFLLDPPVQQGPQVLNSGSFPTPSSRGLRELSVNTTWIANPGGTPPGYYPMANVPPLPGFAVELAGQTGALAQLLGQPAQPMVAATQCPNLAKPQTYQFVTIPAALAPPSPNPYEMYTWDPTTETAYGTVDISSTGDTVTFQNIHQFTLPSEGGAGAPTLPGPSSVSGLCGPTFFGDTISVPGQLMINNPGLPQQESSTGQATVGLGISGGLLVEDNGLASVTPPTGTTFARPYVNVLGAGTGAIGLPQPSSALSTASVVGAQYLGFIYGAGIFPGNGGSPTGWSSHVASFGFSSVPATCASVAPPSSTLIYGGDFSGDDPSSSSGGYGNCDFAIDLGSQSSSTNGLFSGVTVWVGAGYAGNTTGVTYSFPAIAISGPIGGKYAIFVLGVDSTQPWAIDLLQSN